MSEEIFDDDMVSRSLLEPKDFPGGVLDLRVGFQFSSKNQNCESVNCNRLLNNDISEIHKFGLHKQSIDHERGNTQRNYKGYSESLVEPIRKIDISKIAYFEVYHCSENDNNAHCHIKLNYKNKNDRNEAINQLVVCFNNSFIEYKP